MYVVTHRYHFDPKMSEEINSYIREGLVGLIQKAPGFITYYWVDTGEGTGLSLSAFEDKTGAEEAARLTAGYMQRYLAALLGKPSITQGEVRTYAARKD